MERWEIVERRILVAVGLALIALSAWLVMDGERAFFVVLLAPIIFWVFWQAFFEDKLGSTEPVSAAERHMYGTYLWVRRLVTGGIALLLLVLAIAAFKMALDLTAILLLAGLSLFVGWVAIFGAGRAKSMVYDLRIHRERRERYRKP
jgi:hypothetical protein